MVISSSSLVVIHVVMNAEPVSFTVTTISSDPLFVPSLAVSVRVKVVSASTAGAVKVVEAEEPLANVMPGGADQEYDTTESPASGSAADPDRVTVSPSPTVWSGPGIDVRRVVVGVSIGQPENLDAVVELGCDGRVGAGADLEGGDAPRAVQARGCRRNHLCCQWR